MENCKTLNELHTELGVSRREVAVEATYDTPGKKVMAYQVCNEVMEEQRRKPGNRKNITFPTISYRQYSMF